jgi:hypothetical protein
MTVRDVAVFSAIVVVSTLITFWLGPLWYLLSVGLVCVGWVVASSLMARAGL